MFHAEWNQNGHTAHAQLHSVSIHLLLLIALLVPVLNFFTDPGAPEIPKLKPLIYLAGYLPHAASKGPAATLGSSGSGGDRSSEEATRGKLPPFSWLQFTPPTARVQHAKLEMDPTVLGPPDLHPPSPGLLNFGSPFSNVETGKGGPGGGDGFGEKCCGGVGAGKDRGAGADEEWGYAPRAGTEGTTHPECSYCPTPLFTPEAVKAKFQGTVTLRLVVTPDGRATNIRVVQGPGLGLDQAALEAVRNWRFRPALGANHRPTATWITVEVNFRQL